MYDRALFENNKGSLSRENPGLPQLIEEADECRTFVSQLSRSGHVLPCLKQEDRCISFHSRFDPVREGKRIALEYKANNFYIFFGLGGGYHIRPFIERGISSAIIIETDISLLKSTLQTVDLSDIFREPGVRLLLDFSGREIEEYIGRFYIPALMGDLHTVPLRPRIESEPEYFPGIADSVGRASYRTGSDYLTQARFGRTWFLNTLSNLKQVPQTEQTFPHIDRIIITAAGPSLDSKIGEIRSAHKEIPVLATDTSYPALTAAGIDPDYVISIDCQHISYHHFFDPLPKRSALFLDIASPPLLFRRTGKKFLVESSHPLSRYFSRRWLNLPRVDTGGGNVTFAAISLAAELHAREFVLYGADFAYPNAKPYANETYFYPYFRKVENRFIPLESQVSSFSYSRAEEHITAEDGTILYTDSRMIRYKEDLQAYIKNRKINLNHCCGYPPFTISSDEAHAAEKDVYGRRNSGDKTTDALQACNPQLMLAAYQDDLNNLPFPDFSRLNAYLSEIDPYSAELLFTILPGLAFIRQRRRDGELKTLFEENYRWTLETISRYLESG